MRSREERRTFIRDLHGIDLDEPFEYVVFSDETVQWQPITILLGWLALALAEAHGDVEPEEAWRMAHLRVNMLTRDDWDDLKMRVRSFGIRLTDAEVE